MSSAQAIAEILLATGCLSVADKTPFVLTSGRLSPVYLDCRRLIGFRDERRRVTAAAADLLRRNLDLETIDVIAGGETAGIAYAAWLSDALNKPMVYVRKQPKGFGKGKQIEGYFTDQARMLLVEDLTTDGGSKIAFADAIRGAGARIAHVFSIFYYGTIPGSDAQLAKAGLTLHTLCTWQDVLAVAAEKKLWPTATQKTVQDFLADPDGWSQRQTAAG